MTTGNNNQAERVLSALAQSDPNVSEVVAAAAGNSADDIRAIATAMLDRDARAIDFMRAAVIMAHRGKLDRPDTDGSRLLEQLADDEAIIESLSEASRRARRFELRLSDTDVLQLSLDKPGRLHLRLSDTDVLQARLSDTDVLQLRMSKTILRVKLHDTISRWQLSDTDVLQLRLSDTDVLQLRLNNTSLRLKLSDTDVLQLRWSDAEVPRGVNDTDLPRVRLSDTDVLQLSRREKLVSAALEVFDDSGFPTHREAGSSPYRTVAELLSAFAQQDRDEGLLVLLEALVEILPAFQFVSESPEITALERLAAQRPKTLLALARLASEGPDTLAAILRLVDSDDSSGNADEGIAA